LVQNVQPTSAAAGFVEYDENEEAIARLMQEEEDHMRAEMLQNDYYSGNRPPTA
jgi:hypothetical protein